MEISQGLFTPTNTKCAKRRVTAILIPRNHNSLIFGQHQTHYAATNWCFNPQETCPREEGEGYEKCKIICNQPNHAEVNVVNAAGERAKGSMVIVIGHDHCCENCLQVMADAGVAEVIIL